MKLSTDNNNTVMLYSNKPIKVKQGSRLVKMGVVNFI